MRYSRLKRRQTKQRYAAFILIAVLACGAVYLIFAGTLGKFISDYITPILSSFDKNGDTDVTDLPNDNEGPDLTVPDDTADDVVKITDTIRADSLSLKAIQMGAFTDGNNAQAFADELQAKGGAGYVVDDQFYRVLAVGFQKEEDARKVKDQLKEDGIDSNLYPISSNGADMRITATKENVNAVKAAFDIWEEKFLALEDIIINLDSDKIRPADAYTMIEEMKSSIDAKRDELADLASKQENNKILEGLSELYNSGSKTFDDILAQNNGNKVAISSKIKYTYIDMLMQYKKFMEKITGS